MAWFILIVSGLLEAVWATALGKSDGFTRMVPSVLFFGALTLSMAGLGLSLRSIPTPTAYAMWVGIGVMGTAIYAIAFDGYDLSPVKVMFFVLLVASIVGLKLAS